VLIRQETSQNAILAVLTLNATERFGEARPQGVLRYITVALTGHK
jgi:hypothetical protein